MIVQLNCGDYLLLGGYECSKEGSINWACEYLVHIVAGVAAGSILTTVLFGLVCQVIASRIRTQKKGISMHRSFKSNFSLEIYQCIVSGYFSHYICHNIQNIFLSGKV